MHIAAQRQGFPGLSAANWHKVYMDIKILRGFFIVQVV